MLKISLKVPEFNIGKLEKPKIQLAIPAKTFLGIDIGTSALKIVEIGRVGERIKLENYGEMQAPSFYEKQFRSFQKSTLLLSSEDIAKAIKGIFQEAVLKTRNVVFSIPDFSTFFTSFDLPPMTQEEVGHAIEYEARQHVPLPLSDITLDWQIIEGRAATDNQKGTPLKILLVAVPNEVVNQYQQIASLVQLNLTAIEAEVFSLARAITGSEKEVVVLVDIGAQSTTISVVDNGSIKLSHSFDMGGNEFTRRVSQALSINYDQAEQIKKQYGLERSPDQTGETVSVDQTSRAVLAPLIDLVVSEIEKISKTFKQTENKQPKRIILAGGSALLPGIAEYIGYQLKEEIIVSNPFEALFYPPVLEPELKEMGPSWAVAIGAAMRGLE